MRDADTILLSLLHTIDEAESQRLRDELLLEHAAPVIRQTLRQRLHIFGGHQNTDSGVSNADDLFNDVYVKLLEKLHELKRHPEQPRIRNFHVYVARVTSNACSDFVRTKKHERHLLKHKLRNLLERHQDFAIWKEGQSSALCGLANWQWANRGTVQALTSEEICNFVDTLTTQTFRRKNPRNLPLLELAAETLREIGHPLELDVLVEVVAKLLGVRERHTESLDDEESRLKQRLLDAAPLSDALIEGRENLAQLWEEIRKLPAEQRKTVCFSFEDSSGEDLFSLLLDEGLSSVPKLAAEFNLSLEEFNELWIRMPMLDNVELATYLGTSPAQIRLWRYRAYQRLRKRLSDKKNKLFAR